MLPAAASFRRITRAFRRAPGFFLIAVLTLAVGIGATAAIFTVVNAVLLQPLPYPEPERIVAVSHTAPGLDMERLQMSDGTYFIYDRYTRSLDSLGIFWEGSATLTGGKEPARVGASGTTAGVFSVLRVPPAHGRTIQEADEKPGAEPVVVLSDGLWRRSFGGAPSAVGATLQVDGVARSIVGVMPPGFRFPSVEVELWVPMTIDPANLAVGNFSFDGVARLQPGVTPHGAARELSDLAWRVTELPNTLMTRERLQSARFATRVVPLRNEIVGDVQRVLWMLLGSVGLILLIACANVANLFLVRAEGRQREVAVRSALGASRQDLMRLFLGESMALALTGGALGLALAAAGVRALLALQPEGLPRLDEIAVNGTVVAFTVAVALLAGLLVGLFAALRYGRPDLASALKEGGRGGTAGRERLRARSALVVVQVALALVLLVGAGLMVKSFRRLHGVDPGIDPRNLLTLQLNLPESEYKEPQKVARFVIQLLEKVRALPGVQSAGTSSLLPLTGGESNNGHLIEDFPLNTDEVPPVLATRWVSPGYFETMRIPLLQGRAFERIEADSMVREAVVSQALAEHFWPGKSPLGKRLAPGPGDNSQWATIVGVVASSRDDGLHQKPAEAVYYPMQPQVTFGEVGIPRGFTLAVRSDGDPLRLVAPVRGAIWSLDPNLPLDEVRPMEDVVERSMVRTTFTMLLLVIAGFVALVLGTVGIYAVISSVVSQRTREIGVRMALGAGRGDIARMVLREGLGLTLAGIALGLLGAFAATRLMMALLFDVSPTDPVTFVAVPALLALIALFACWMPAQRAAAVPPLEAIRNE
ncbi:MAG TPA: ABC transporter permease [Thermoanaerobaculia bacterium]|jgi:predicted permease|nr:ABC transporter permease [Thermoanaerobaculia bacterium]